MATPKRLLALFTCGCGDPIELLGHPSTYKLNAYAIQARHRTRDCGFIVVTRNKQTVEELAERLRTKVNEQFKVNFHLDYTEECRWVW